MFCKSCEPEIVLICTLAKQFHGRKSNKTRESTLLCLGNFEEIMDLSHIYLAVLALHNKKLTQKVGCCVEPSLCCVYTLYCSIRERARGYLMDTTIL